MPLTGGKFANGAVTAAMAHLFNAKGVLQRGLEGSQSGINEVGRANAEAICDPMIDLAAAAYAVLSPTAGLTECCQAECGVGGWVAAAAMSLPGMRPVAGVIKVFTVHGMDQAINRGVSPSAILDAVRNPIKVNPVKFDDLGRPSQRFTGRQSEVAINPETGRVVLINPDFFSESTEAVRVVE